MIIGEGQAQINLKFLWPTSGQRAQVVYGVHNTLADHTAEEVATAVLAAYDDNGMAQIQGGSIKLDTILVKLGPNDTGNAFEIGADIAGTLSGTLATPQNSLLVTKVTAEGGRKGRGRMYWPGTQEGVWDNYGVIDNAARATFQSHFDDWFDSHTAAELPMALLHGDPDTPSSTITSLLVRNLIATQRRRLGR